MLTAHQVATFQTQGYLKGEQVLKDAEVEELRQEMLRVIRDQHAPDVRQPVRCVNLAGDPKNPVWQIVNISDASDAFGRLVHHPRIVEEIAQLTEAREIRLWHDQVQYKPAGIGGVNMWHQDWPYWNILDNPSQVTAWVALDDVDAANGCMSMIPGSHRWGNNIEFLHTMGKDFQAMPAQFQGHALKVRLCPVRKGHVHYHHAMTWHGSHANTSDRPRRAIAMHYMTEQTRYLSGGTHIMKQFVDVPDGAKLQGNRFPRVWGLPA